MTTEDEIKQSLKQRVKLSRAIGLLTGVKDTMKVTDEINKDGLIKLIDEVLELLK